MTWDHPFWLFAAISLPLIILLHLLARRRREITVPSLYIWQRLLENTRPSLRFRRLIADLLLILQLISAGLAVVALAGPRTVFGGSSISGPSVIAIDTSAGMGAVDEDGRNRFEDALDQAENLIRSKASGAEMALLAGGGSLSPVSGFTRSRRRLLLSLRDLEPGDEAGKPEPLLRAASALASSRKGARVIFITDGAFDESVSTAIPVESLSVSRPGNNAGITLFDIHRLPGGGRELTVAVENFGQDSIGLDLDVNLNERSLLSETLIINPGERIVRSLVWQEDFSGELRGSLSQSGDGSPYLDSLIADNQVSVLLSPDDRINAVLYTPENWFLETLLASHTGLNLEIRRGSGEDATFDQVPEGTELLILDRITPQFTSTYPVLAIYPFEARQPELPISVGSSILGRDPVSWDSDHPVMMDVDLSRVSVSRSILLEPVPGSSVLAESSASPLLISGDDGDRRWVVLSFDLLKSSLPINSAFPILISNAVNWLVPGEPDGKRVSGLLDAGESDLRSRWKPDLVFGEKSSLDWVESRDESYQSGTDRTIPYSQPLTAILLLAALVAILSEWIVQTRLWRRR